ncbi:MAG: VIT and VWA domain-containing protein [Woeseiaceae bacterium]
MKSRSSLVLARNTAGLTNAEPALALVNPEEEVWIIAQPAAYADETAQDDSPGTGSMVAEFPVDDGGDPQKIPLPLKHTAVNAQIDGYISAVNVKQTFENPYATRIEAVYLFPLPEKSAINEFVMTIGDRRIRGILREKEEAREIYEQARSQGYRASLLVQHRPNVFEQKVANIEPGKSIDIDIKYFHTLTYNDGWYSFVFPTVVGPRFNPPGTENPIHAQPRGTQPAGNGATVTYLRPEERSGHDLSIAVTVNAGVPIEELRSTHAIDSSRPQREKAVVSLTNKTTVPNRDFILDFKVAGDRIRSNLLTHVEPSSGQGYFTMMLYPPAGLEALPRQPMELVFVLDNSGSMSGRPIRQAKEAIAQALTHLREDDTFQIIRFSDNASHFGPAPVPATQQNIANALNYVRNLHGSGGTMMIEGIKAALDFPHDPSRLRFVSFMTDGYIGNDKEIIGEVHKRIGASRVFSFGVGSSVNRYLLERMATEGRGAVAYLGPQDSGAEIMGSFFARISRPAMTDLSIDWGNMRVSDVYPSRAPDIFVGRPVFITGRFTGQASSVVVSGLAGNETRQFVINPNDDDESSANLSKIWARLRIADLSDRQAWESDPGNELGIEIRETALRYQLMSDYTSFVAVDSSERR